MAPHLPFPRLLILLIAAALPLAAAHATSDRTYKKNEFLTITDGLSPDKLHSMAAHGDGDLGSDNFHVYLMTEPGHKKIGPLTEIGDNEYLGTAPEAFWARWSPDSRYVAILYREGRRVITFRLYRIENSRAHILSGPTPLKAAGLAIDLPSSAQGDDQREQRMRGFTLTWTGPTRFQLTEDGRIWVDPLNGQSLGKYGTITTDPAGTGAPQGLHQVEYNIDAECEITGGDKYTVIDIKRGQ